LQPFLAIPLHSSLNLDFLSSLITLGFEVWCSSSYNSSLANLVSRFYYSIFYGSSLAILKCFHCFCWCARTCVYVLWLSTIPMLLVLCWFSPYELSKCWWKISDLSLLGSFNMLKEFCLWIWKIEFYIQTCAIALWIWACYFWEEWDVFGLGGKLETFF
jgi:hypothetical protein